MEIDIEIDTNRPLYRLCTDGGCLGPNKIGAWAFVLTDLSTNTKLELCRGCNQTTNNRMELLAVIRGLEAINCEAANVELISDSQYVTKGITEWLPTWKRKNWRRSGTGQVLNVDLWKTIDFLTRKHQVTTIWVKGHNGHPENELCDKLCTDKIEEFKLRSLFTNGLSQQIENKVS